MSKIRTQFATFGAGIAMVLASLTPATSPLNNVFLIGGSGIAAMGYGLVFLSWWEKQPARGRKVQQVLSRAKAPDSSVPTPPTAPSSEPPSLQTPPTVQPPSPPNVIAGSTTPTVTPVSEKPKLPERKLPKFKAPKLPIPPSIIEHRVPIGFVATGTILIVAALATISPQAGLFAGLLIPGMLLFGVGSVILLLELLRRPAALRRFCMHCGFQMLSTDAACARCHRQPPSGVDTRVCPNCNAVIPALAQFCKDCGAGQPPSP